MHLSMCMGKTKVELEAASRIVTSCARKFVLGSCGSKNVSLVTCVVGEAKSVLSISDRFLD